MNIGYVYVLHNPIYNYYGEVYKIGQTKDLNARIKSYITSYPEEPEIKYSIYCINYKSIEKEIHEKLKEYRINTNREYFKCSFDLIKNVFDFYSTVREDHIEELYKEQKKEETFKPQVKEDLPKEKIKKVLEQIQSKTKIKKSHINESSNSKMFRCDFCGNEFSDTSKFNRHIKTSKKCLSSRPNIKISCVWCNKEFISNIYLEKHNCSEDKESIYLTLLDKYNILETQLDIIIEDRDKKIKELYNKMLLIENSKSSLNKELQSKKEKQYITKLKCGKPMIFSLKNIIKRLIDTLSIDYIMKGEEGLSKWVIDHGCRNEKGELAIQLTDKNRRIVKYIDKNDNIKRLEKDEFILFFENVLKEFNQTKEGQYLTKDLDKNSKEYIAFNNPGNKFFKNIVKSTYREAYIQKLDEED